MLEFISMFYYKELKAMVCIFDELVKNICGFQVVPHITDAIKNWIESVSSVPVDGKNGPADVCVIELGGTVGRIYIDKMLPKPQIELLALLKAELFFLHVFR